MPSYEELLQEISELRRRLAEQERQLEERECQAAELKSRIAQLEKLVDELQRRGKRQASPFSKGEPSASILVTPMAASRARNLSSSSRCQSVS